MLWYDRRLMPGGTRLDFDRIRPTTLRTFGLMWAGPSEQGETIELRMGFSLRGCQCPFVGWGLRLFGTFAVYRG